MQHLSEEDLVLHHYHDGAAPAEAALHLRGCAECREQLATIQRVLALVDVAPLPERGEDYGATVWNRLRWKLEAPRNRRLQWKSAVATAAVLTAGMFAGHFLSRQTAGTKGVPAIASSSTTPGALPAHTTNTPTNDRMLVLVVGDHLDNTERVLLEVANADPKHDLEFRSDQKRTAELVASNRIYRQAATKRGDQRIAALLSDLEPVLVELAHAGPTLSASEVESLQRRIDSRGLLFKVKVLGTGEQPPAAPEPATKPTPNSV